MRTARRRPLGGGKILGAGLVAAVCLWTGLATAGDVVRLGTTTSVEDSGLLEHLLPPYSEARGTSVLAIVRGTGEALAIARRGDVDVLLVHDTEAERAFVAEGDGLARADLMVNDFIIVGPVDDPANIAGGSDAPAALARIAAADAPFISRGDNSGTHRRERALWRAAPLSPDANTDDWYLESGSGQGTTLNIASARAAYALTDRGTWLAFRNKGDLRILVEGDPLLRNVYGVVLIDPARHPDINSTGARDFAEWLLSPDGQAVIGAHRIDGTQAFHPAAGGWED